MRQLPLKWLPAMTLDNLEKYYRDTSGEFTVRLLRDWDPFSETREEFSSREVFFKSVLYPAIGGSASFKLTYCVS